MSPAPLKRGSAGGSVHLMCEEAFRFIDKNGDGVLLRIEIIQACRHDAKVAKLLRLPQNIRQEDGSRDRFEQYARPDPMLYTPPRTPTSALGAPAK